MKGKKPRAYLLMTFVVIVWGSTFVLVKDALTDATPMAFNLARMTLAFLVLAVIYRSHWREVTRHQILAGAIVGLFLAMGYAFQTSGLAKTTASKSAFITGLVVVLVPLFSTFRLLRPPGAKSPRWNAYLGAILAFGGILFLTLPTGSKSLVPDFTSMNIGDLLSFGCAVGFTFHCLALGHISPRIKFQPLALLQVGFCALFMGLAMPFVEHPHLHLTMRLTIALTIAAVLATAAAFSIQSWAQSILPTTHTALLLTLEPVFAWITSFLVLNERLTLRPASGAILILAGIALTELIPPTPRTHRARSLMDAPETSFAQTGIRSTHVELQFRPAEIDEMKTLSNPEDRAEIIRRIGMLSPQSTRQWGAMTVDAMICHLYDAYQVAIGEKIAHPVKMPLPQRIMKAFALRSPGQWPKGLPTPDEVKQGIGGTPACEFAADRRRLLVALDRFFVCEKLASIAHPYFGKMSDKDWMRWGYLHADHHLRQFGV